MTIRAKLYLAIALTVLGPLATIAVALHGQNTLDDRFDEVQDFMRLDDEAWSALQDGRPGVTKRILLGPEIDNFEEIAGTAERLAAYETRAAGAAEAAFDDARDDVRRRLIAVALGAAVVIVLLLLTASDIARLAVEGERRRRGAGA